MSAIGATIGVARRPRTPGMVYAAIAVALAVIVAVVAVSATQPPPPTIAEFAPQAVEQIKEAPQEQSGEVGEAEGGGGGPAAVAPPSLPPKAPPVDVPRVRRCVGNPPRQIEDPQSPPCVAYWKGDNKGATSKGVTHNTIRIAVPYEEGEVGNPLTPTARALEAFFNKRFEFYGRKIELVKIQGKEHEAQNPDPAKQRADAVDADSQEVFASTAYAEQGGLEYEYHDELARRGIVSAYSGWPVMTSEDHFSAHHPHQWSPQPGGEEIAIAMGEWICKQLAGWKAEHAGQEVLRSQKRKFGVVVNRAPDGRKPDLDEMYRQLAACDAKVATTIEIEQGTDVQDVTTQHTNAALRLKQDGITTVISFNQFVHLHLTQTAATNSDYFPEWLISSYQNQTTDWSGQTFGSSRQLENTFGLSFYNKMVPSADRPVRWALREIDPSLEEGDGGWGPNLYLYWPLLVLASGIQMGGPDLTPETFASGLARAGFPNPGNGAAPYYQAFVDFGPRDHSFWNDASVVWWNPSSTSHENGLGGRFCSDGKRYRPGSFPRGEPRVFEGPCP